MEDNELLVEQYAFGKLTLAEAYRYLGYQGFSEREAYAMLDHEAAAAAAEEAKDEDVRVDDSAFERRE